MQAWHHQGSVLLKRRQNARLWLTNTMELYLLFSKTEALAGIETQTERKDRWTQGGTGEWRRTEISTDIHTLPCVKQTARRKPLYTQGPQLSAPWCPRGWDGARAGREPPQEGDACILTAHSLCCAAEVNITLQSDDAPIKVFLKNEKDSVEGENLLNVNCWNTANDHTEPLAVWSQVQKIHSID